MTFVIPRTIFEGQLGPLAKELGFVNRLLRHVSEAVTGRPEQIEVAQLSSTTPMFVFLASLPVVYAVGQIVNIYLDCAKKGFELRDLIIRARGAKADAVVTDALTKQIEDTEAKAIEDTIRALHEQGAEVERGQEVGNGLRLDLRRLYELIDHGLTIEIRAAEPEPAEGEDPASQFQYAEVKRMGKILQFPQIAGTPIHQLSPPPPDDGDSEGDETEKGKHPAKGKKSSPTKH